VFHGTGDYDTAAVVLGRDDISHLEELNVAALSLSSPSMVSDVAPEFSSSTWN
jgi:hypothetical protein